MAQNEQIVEVVTFKENGLGDINAGTQKLAQNATDLTQKYGQFASAVEKAQRRNEQFARAMRDGSYERHVRQMAKLNDQYLQLQRRADAIARYGPRLGALLGNGTVQAAGRFGLYAAGAGVATVGAMARSGLSGTVEGNRMNLEAQLLSREVAGVFKPLTDGVTNATMKIRKWMEGLSESNQDMLMYGGALVAGTVALRALVGANTFGALAGGVMSAATSPLAFMKANGRGVAGAAGLGLLAYGSSTGHRGTAAAGGALAGYSVAGPWGAAIGGTIGAVEASGDYGRYRAADRSVAASAGLAIMSNLSDLGDYFTGGDETEKWRKKMDAFIAKKKAKEESHRKVTIADAGFEGVGSGYDRLSTALALVDASKSAAEADKAAANVGLTKAIEVLTETIRAAGASPMPRPAGGA